jgi:hypothetical protein
VLGAGNARTKAAISDQFQYFYVGSENTEDAVLKIRFRQALIAPAVICSSSKEDVGAAQR